MKYKEGGRERSGDDGKMCDSTNLPVACSDSLSSLAFYPPLWLKARKMDSVRSLLPCRTRSFKRRSNCFIPRCKLLPKMRELWAMQGAAYAGEGNPKEALASFRSALKISPDYLPALEGAIQIEYEAGDPAAIPLLLRVAALTTRRCNQSGHARGAGVSTRKLWRCGRSF